MIDDFKKVPERKPSRIGNDSNTDNKKDATTPYVRRSTPAYRSPERIAADEAKDDNGQELLLAEHATPDAAAADGSSAVVEDPSAWPATPPTGEPDASAAPKQTAAPTATITLFKRWTVPRKKFFIITAVVALLLLCSGTALALHAKHQPAKVAAKSTAVAKAAPKPIVSPLTGMPVTADQLKLPVTGVMIENSPDARPQSGLKDAGVVFEAIAEAGITRFLALYQEAQPDNVGPVRSSRPYYLDWAMAFDAGYAHVGGSPDALQRIKDINVKDLDQFYNADSYHRITTRYAPHNVYTGVNQLTALEKSKGYDSSSYTSLPRKAEQPYKAPAAAPATSSSNKTTTTKPAGDARTPAKTIDFAISGAYYNVHYDYDAAANDYKRSEGGAAHIDANSNTQLTPKVVISLVMPYSLMADGYHSMYTTIGSGKMYVFQDGTVTTGTWSKGQPKEQFVFKTDAGKTMALDPGQTWISVVGNTGEVAYN